VVHRIAAATIILQCHRLSVAQYCPNRHHLVKWF